MGPINKKAGKKALIVKETPNGVLIDRITEKPLNEKDTGWPTVCAQCIANGKKITLELSRISTSGKWERYERTFSDIEIEELCNRAKPYSGRIKILVQFRLMLSSGEEFTSHQLKHFRDLITEAGHARP